MSNVTEQEFGTLLSIVSRCDEAQTRRVIEAINNRRATIGRMAIRSIRPGQKVKWNGKHGPKTGVVARVKQKYVEVKEDGVMHMTWNVPASMLEVVP